MKVKQGLITSQLFNRGIYPNNHSRSLQCLFICCLPMLQKGYPGQCTQLKCSTFNWHLEYNIGGFPRVQAAIRSPIMTQTFLIGKSYTPSICRLLWILQKNCLMIYRKHRWFHLFKEACTFEQLHCPELSSGMDVRHELSSSSLASYTSALANALISDAINIIKGPG